jgi:hypothetical protein
MRQVTADRPFPVRTGDMERLHVTPRIAEMAIQMEGAVAVQIRSEHLRLINDIKCLIYVHLMIIILREN